MVEFYVFQRPIYGLCKLALAINAVVFGNSLYYSPLHCDPFWMNKYCIKTF